MKVRDDGRGLFSCGKGVHSVNAIDRVIAVATGEIGYLEKKSNKDLDSKTANAGSANYTKYNRDLKNWTGGGSLSAQWCQAFVDWCFIKAFGVDDAKKLIYVFTNYTPTGSNAFKKRGRYIKRGQGKPKRGDVIYFYSKSKGRIGHVGIVYKVSGNTVYTIEGNTSGASSLVTNGGGVKKKSYSMSSTYIDGYGSVDYAALGTSGDEGIAPTGALKNGDEGADVKAMQEGLIRLGFDCGRWGADGDFGDCTELALRDFQKRFGLPVTGVYGKEDKAMMDKALDALDKPVADPSYVEIFGGNCYVRLGPGVEYEAIGVAYEGSRWPYTGIMYENGWLKVEWKGKEGWVSPKYARLVE